MATFKKCVQCRIKRWLNAEGLCHQCQKANPKGAA